MLGTWFFKQGLVPLQEHKSSKKKLPNTYFSIRQFKNYKNKKLFFKWGYSTSHVFPLVNKSSTDLNEEASLTSATESQI